MDTLIQNHVEIRKEFNMRELKKEEMKKVEGGTSFSAAMLGAIYKVVETIYNLGDALGSSIRRIIEGKNCSL